MDAETGQSVATAPTTNDVDDWSQVGPLRDWVMATVASFTADGAYDQEGVAAAIAERHSEAVVTGSRHRSDAEITLSGTDQEH
jgi:hypothetical protein